MGYDSFYTYTGCKAALFCKVRIQRYEYYSRFPIFAFTNRVQRGGLVLLFQQQHTIDRYVVYNYVENAWSYGNLSRTAWLDRNIVNYPRATGGNYLYEHEFGFDDDGSPIQMFL